MKIVEFLDENNLSPYQIWLGSLDNTVAVKIVVAKARLSSGNKSAIKWFDGIGEYRIDSGPGYRIYLAEDGDTIILYGGGTKKGQQQDINNAKKLHAEYKAAKKLQAECKAAKKSTNKAVKGNSKC